MGLKKLYATDESAEAEGVWNDFGGVFRVKIARAGSGNPQFVKELSRAAKRANGVMTPDMERTALQNVYANTVVKGWQTFVDGQWVDGIDMDDEGILQPTPENIQRVFQELPDIYTSIVRMADDASNYRKTALEAQAKN